jgi:hypothetical protein
VASSHEEVADPSVDNFVQQQVFKEVAPLLVVGKLHSTTLKLCWSTYFTTKDLVDLFSHVHGVTNHPKSICSSAQYVTLDKYFSHPSLVIYLFAVHTHKTKAGTANR